MMSAKELDHLWRVKCFLLGMTSLREGIFGLPPIPKWSEKYNQTSKKHIKGKRK